jgi:hypothetical protein
VQRAGRLLEWSGVVQRRAYVGRLDAALRGYYQGHWRRLSLFDGVRGDRR